MSLRSIVIGVLLCGFAANAGAQAESSGVFSKAPDEEARRLYKAGSERFDARDFTNAATMFQHAYELSHRKELLYNIGVCHRELGELEPALDSFRQYLAFAGPDGNNAEAVRQQIADLERLVPAKLEVHSRGKTAHLTLDGTAAGNTPFATTLPAGTHVLVASGAGPEDRLSLALVAGERRLVEVGRAPRTKLWVGVGVGAAVLVIAGVVTVSVLATRPAELHPGTLDPQIINVR